MVFETAVGVPNDDLRPVDVGRILLGFAHSERPWTSGQVGGRDGQQLGSGGA